MGDVPLVDAETLTGLVEAHEESGAAATMLTAELEDPTGYGRVVRDAEGQVERVVETKTAGDASEAELAIREVNTGIFAFDGGALLDALEQLESDNAQGELYLPDVLPRMREAGREVGAHVATRLGRHARHQRPRRPRRASARIAQERINEAHMRAGVTIVDPRSAHIDAGVDDRRRHGDRAGLRAPRRHHDRRAACTIGAFTTLIDSEIGDGATVLRSHLRRRARAARRRTVGPFAYLRPDAVLQRGRQGRHVRGDQELDDRRRARKVPHLSYIGDADVGEGTNLGASTITANYDGAHEAPHHDRRPRAHERRHHVRRPGDRRRRRLHGRRHR